MPVPQSLKRLWTLDKFATSLRGLLAFSGALGFALVSGEIATVIPLFLGIIASALSETDDTWRGRLLALIVTLACFALVSLIIHLLFPWPWLMMAWLALSTFGLIMLGAIGQRYATIATGTLILSIYTMISLAQHTGGGAFEDAQRQGVLLIGVAWYGLISVIWSALFARQPVKQGMARLYRVLGRYLVLKATLFEPVRGVDIQARRMALARHNGEVVNALNQVREVLFRRMENQRGNRRFNRYLQIYFVGQDIHERASSTHYPYSALIEAFFHHDVLFRCQRLLDQQGQACRRLARALLMERTFDHRQSEEALLDLRASIDHLTKQSQPPGRLSGPATGSDASKHDVLEGDASEGDAPERWRRLLRPLNALADNLATLESQIACAHNPDARSRRGDDALHDRSPANLKDAWQRVRLNLTASSPTFRHAVRLAVALVSGFMIVQVVDPEQGFWILLTTLFVCRPNFVTTRRYLVKRILGTVLGLVAGWASITLFPQPTVQALIAVVAGVSFFANRERFYTLATASITLLVLCSFNQIGNGYDLIVPRLLDTLIGALLAALAVLFVLPDWKGRKLHREAAHVMRHQRRYLDEIIAQYVSGKQDDLAYRLARRNAHNSDAAFSTQVNNMLHEPALLGRDGTDGGLRFLLVSNTLLSHLSALGAHRHRLAAGEQDADLLPIAKRISALLEGLAEHLDQARPMASLEADATALLAELDTPPGESVTDPEYRPMLSQLGLIVEQFPALSEAANRLIVTATRP